ncbi:MAG: hypothetical protein JWQ85_294 [Mucilaginibacter sp.]|jgi:hypothetical protein|nr:hypothetical protein [Mucilaginibacter sp.]
MKVVPTPEGMILKWVIKMLGGEQRVVNWLCYKWVNDYSNLFITCQLLTIHHSPIN